MKAPCLDNGCNILEHCLNLCVPHRLVFTYGLGNKQVAKAKVTVVADVADSDGWQLWSMD